jgi:hypothetical protein
LTPTLAVWANVQLPRAEDRLDDMENEVSARVQSVFVFKTPPSVTERSLCGSMCDTCSTTKPVDVPGPVWGSDPLCPDCKARAAYLRDFLEQHTPLAAIETFSVHCSGDHYDNMRGILHVRLKAGGRFKVKDPRWIIRLRKRDGDPVWQSLLGTPDPSIRLLNWMLNL